MLNFVAFVKRRLKNGLPGSSYFVLNKVSLLWSAMKRIILVPHLRTIISTSDFIIHNARMNVRRGRERP